MCTLEIVKHFLEPKVDLTQYPAGRFVLLTLLGNVTETQKLGYRTPVLRGHLSVKLRTQLYLKT